MAYPENSIWINEEFGTFNSALFGQAASGPQYLNESQWCKLERIRQARMLFKGRHRCYFISERRTQFDFPEAIVNGVTARPYTPFNILKLISKKTSDLLFGQAPLLRVDDPIQQIRLTDLVERSSVHELCKNTQVECSYEGEAFLEACVKNGKVYLRRIIADQIHTEGELQPDGQFDSYVRYEEANIGTERSPLIVLLETRWLADAIERKLWQLDAKKRKTRQLKLELWPAYADGNVPAERIATGIDRNLITWVPNELDHDQPVSDYDGLIELQDVLNAKYTQLNRVIQQHTDPTLAAHASSFDTNGNLPARQKIMAFRDRDSIPQYITFDSQLEAAIKEKGLAQMGLLVLGEMSPVLLGLKEGAAPDAWRKLRLEASNALSMAQRKAATWVPRLRRALSIAQDLEQTIPGTRYDRYPIAAELRDGIPIDDKEQAETIATLRGSGVMSVRRAVETQLVDSAAVEKELDELDEEKAAATPSFFPAANAAGAESGEQPADGGQEAA